MAELEANANVKISVSATLRTRVNLALHHLLAACRNASRIRQLELEHQGEPFGAFWEEVLHCSLSVVSLTVASIESYANEVLADSAGLPESMNAQATKEIADIIDRKPILDKFRIALSLISGATLPKDGDVYRRTKLLIDVRNAVVHFRPEWFDSQAEHQKLSAKLAGEVTGSPFLGNEPLFPRAWASSAFADWSLRTTIAYLDAFFAAAGVKNSLSDFKPQLSALAGIEL